MPKKLRPAVDLMAFKCRTLKVKQITTGMESFIEYTLRYETNIFILIEKFLCLKLCGADIASAVPR
jgi:hypothetical protein